jgi:hypothetical protein
MIRKFKLYADNERVWGVFLKYGPDDSRVTLEEVTKVLADRGITEYQAADVERCLQAGEYQTIDLGPAPSIDIPGACWILVKEDKTIMACITASLGRGKPLTSFDVVEEIKVAGYGDHFRQDDVISRNLQALLKTPKLSMFQVVEARDALIEVEMARDLKTAMMSFSRAHGGAKLTYEGAIAKLNAAGVNYGIDENRLKEILDANRDVKNVLIATALEPIAGKDAELKFLFDAYGTKVGPRIKEHDLADFRDLGLFENAELGQVLAEKIPATAGTEGKDVSGAVMKAKPGKDIPLPKGKGTKISDENPNLLVAALGGSPRLVAGKVVVEEVLTVGDIDFSTGNIDFHGSVIVKGIVNNGFKVSAGRDLDCTDVVEGADLIAGGNIHVKRGIKGLGKSSIKAGGNVFARFIERCHVEAGASVIVDEALIHSNTAARDSVEVTGAKGSIFGGNVIAGTLIRANFIGSEMAIKTNLEVGASPHLHDKLEALNHELSKKNSDFVKADKNLSVLRAMRAKGPLTESREELYRTLLTVTAQLREEIDQAEGYVAQLEVELQQVTEGRVEAGKTIFPGVKITIKNSMRRIQEPIHKAVFLRENGEVVLAMEVSQANEDE